MSGNYNYDGYDIGFAKYDSPEYEIEVIPLDTEGLDWMEFQLPIDTYLALIIKNDENGKSVFSDEFIEELTNSGYHLDYTPLFYDKFAKANYHVWIFESAQDLEFPIERIEKYLNSEAT